LGFGEKITITFVFAGDSPGPCNAVRVGKAFIAAGCESRGFEGFISVATDSSLGKIFAAAATAFTHTIPSLSAVDRGGRHVGQKLIGSSITPALG
jgi:hypothetical protein